MAIPVAGEHLLHTSVESHRSVSSEEQSQTSHPLVSMLDIISDRDSLSSSSTKVSQNNNDPEGSELSSIEQSEDSSISSSNKADSESQLQQNETIM